MLARSVTHDRVEMIQRADALAQACQRFDETALLVQLREWVPEFVEESDTRPAGPPA
jgi:hypothetical protein